MLQSKKEEEENSERIIKMVWDIRGLGDNWQIRKKC
jgi:hypothetical protein